ncbi:hypothetical protein ACHAWF_003955 [Thalassiosira exigua]
MMVETRLEEYGKAEDSSFYEVVSEVPTVSRDWAEREIDEEDKDISPRREAGDGGVDDLDMEFRDRMERALAMPRHFQIAQKRWARLVDGDAHNKLLAAAKREVYRNQRGSLEGAGDIGEDCDPLADF